MKIVIGADVDPHLPAILDSRPTGDIWLTTDGISTLKALMGAELPPITWLIRADDSIRFATGSFASGYESRARLWLELMGSGHELGWHFHCMSMQSGVNCFDPDPAWFHEAHQNLSRHFDIRAVRVGWDFGSNRVFDLLEEAKVRVDFSALPGNLTWHRCGSVKLVVNWQGCPELPYYPSRQDYRKEGSRDARAILEIPITQFKNDSAGVIRRVCWRVAHGNFSMEGLGHKTRLMTQSWTSLPKLVEPNAECWAFYFHPEDLTAAGVQNFVENARRLRAMPGAEFVTASQALDACARNRRTHV
ncbi:MAG: hypothetical protein ABSD20_13505 [Terriglobales bacterium]|jgi:hypothetical protein